MKFLWPVLLAIFRTCYLAYALWCLLFPLGMIWLLREGGSAVQWLVLGFSVILIVLVYQRRSAGDPNPWQSGFMSWFGTLRWFWNAEAAPMVAVGLPSGYLVENPGGYRTSGRDLRAILNVLKPGDILLRGYAGYVDGAFIRKSARCSEKGYAPGWFTHAALYVGALGEEDRAHVPAAFAKQSGFFDTGPQMVIHSMAKGVHAEDILTFCRCDYLAILRIKPTLAPLACLPAQSRDKPGLPMASSRLCQDLEHSLRCGQPVDSAQAIAAAKLSALEKIGEKYDFDCSDTTEFHRFSCSELVYYCFRGIHGALDLHPALHAWYPLGMLSRKFALLKRMTLTPDDYYDLVSKGTLECVWEDQVSARAHQGGKP